MISQADLIPESPLDEVGTLKTLGKIDSSFVHALTQDIGKFMKRKGNNTKHQADNEHSFAHFTSMVSNNSHSNICCAMQNGYCGSWIVDAGTSDHMTYNL